MSDGTTPAASPPPAPPGLRFAFSVELRFDHRIETPPLSVGTRRGSLAIVGGTVRGPAISGTVLPGGGDAPIVRPDGVALIEARYLFRTDDGVHVAVVNRGIRRASAEVVARLSADESAVDADEYYLRTTPTFEVEPGRGYDWLADHVFVGVGRRLVGGNRIDFFEVL